MPWRQSDLGDPARWGPALTDDRHGGEVYELTGQDFAAATSWP